MRALLCYSGAQRVLNLSAASPENFAISEFPLRAAVAAVSADSAGTRFANPLDALGNEERPSQLIRSSELAMLVLTRKAGEEVVIGEDIVISVFHMRGKRVKLGIHAPPHVSIRRQELRIEEPREIERQEALVQC